MKKPRRVPRRVKSKAKPRHLVPQIAGLPKRRPKPAPTIVYDDILGAPIIIPHGVAYQWVRHSVMGEVDATSLDSAAQRGWKPVPFKRHAKDISVGVNDGGKIVRQGLILMEAPREVAEAQLNAGRDAAKALYKTQIGGAEDQLFAMMHLEGNRVTIMSPQFVASEPYETVPSGAAPVDIQMFVTVRLDARGQDAANALKLQFAEYVKRQMLMTPGVLYPINPPPADPYYGHHLRSDINTVPSFEFWPFPFTLARITEKQ